MKIIDRDALYGIKSLLQARLYCVTAMSSSVCYKCNRTGHFARECTQGGVVSRDSGFNRQREKCFKCNRIGHFARDCKEEADRCYRLFNLFLIDTVVGRFIYKTDDGLARISQLQPVFRLKQTRCGVCTWHVAMSCNVVAS